MKEPRTEKSLELTEYDIHLFKEGSHFNLYDKMGSHLCEKEEISGTLFRVWAPNARSVAVVGNFNGWNPVTNPLGPRWDGSGIWEGFISGVAKGEVYKYHIVSNHNDYRADKGDPFANLWELSPKTASQVWDLDYEWQDKAWMKGRGSKNSLNAPMSIYEVHPGSWQRNPHEDNRSLTYRELAVSLVNYVKEMGFTHVEFLPLMEHPFYGSWGYQTVGYFAPTSRYGTPQDFMYLVDSLHQAGIGVFLDWVPSHFPTNENGLGYFDGTHLYEHEDMKKGFHPDWKTYIFNFGRNEVKNFLISNALFWLDKYHVDGLRVDAVASMLYLDYSRNNGEWIPNCFGGRENLEAISFIKKFNEAVYGAFPDVQTIAEESTAWPMVSRPSYLGGLGFGLKWNMGWMHDTLTYASLEPIHRKFHHNQLTFSMMYAFTENFVLPFSHDEVVYGKGSMLRKMPGDLWQKFAGLRLLLGYMYMHPGKKVLFMGAEFGQWDEWSHDKSLDWHLLENDTHQGVKRWVQDLNQLYRNTPALHARDFTYEGFQWIDCQDYEQSVLVFIRKNQQPEESVIIAVNFTPVPRHQYRVGAPLDGFWKEVLNSDSEAYGGSGQGNLGGRETVPVPSHGMNQSLLLTLPPLGITVLAKE